MKTALTLLTFLLLLACNEAGLSPIPEEEISSSATDSTSKTDNSESTSPEQESIDPLPQETNKAFEEKTEEVKEPTSPEDSTNSESVTEEKEEPELPEEPLPVPQPEEPIKDSLLIQTFGTGERTSSPYIPNLCYEDGTGTCGPHPNIRHKQYAIADPTTLPEYYLKKLPDHTNLPNGRLLAIDMGTMDGDIYRQTVSGAKAGERYKASMWVGSMPIKNPKIFPMMEMVILQDGQELLRVPTGTVPVNGKWHSYTGEFIANSDNDITFVIENKKLDNMYNDPVMDDFTIIRVP